MDKKTTDYLNNEIACYFKRRKQIKRYIQKIHGLLNGLSIKEVKKKYPPIHFENTTEVKKNG